MTWPSERASERASEQDGYVIALPRATLRLLTD